MIRLSVNYLFKKDVKMSSGSLKRQIKLRIDGSRAVRQDAGAHPHQCQTRVIPYSSFICCHCQHAGAAPANCCYDYSCCLNGGRRGVVSIASREAAPRVKVDHLGLFISVIRTERSLKSSLMLLTNTLTSNRKVRN